MNHRLKVLAVLAQAAWCAASFSAYGTVIGVEPARIDIKSGQTASMEIDISFALTPASQPFTYEVFMTDDQTCSVGPEPITWVQFDDQLGVNVDANSEQFQNYTIGIEFSGFPPLVYYAYFCIWPHGAGAATPYAIPVTLYVEPDYIFAANFDYEVH